MNAETTSVLTRIMEIMAATDPLRLRKTDLLEMRRQVLELATAGLERPSKPLHVFADLPLAYQLVLNFTGEDQFMAGLLSQLRLRGSLSPAQKDAVVCPPRPEEIAELRSYRIKVPKYRHQAIQMLREARAQLRVGVG